MRKVLSIILSVAMIMSLVACANKTEKVAESSTTTVAETSATETSEAEKEIANENAGEDIDRRSGSPWIDSELEGAIQESDNFSLKDDFAASMNKDYVLNTKFLPGYNAMGPFRSDIPELVKKQEKEIITDTSETTDKDLMNLRNLYKLWLDFDKRNETGIDPLIPYVKEMDSIQTIKDLNNYFKKDKGGKYDLNSLFPYGVSTDVNDSTKNIMILLPTNLLLGDSAEYSNMTEMGARTKEGYSSVFKYMLGRLGYSDSEINTKINNAFEFETELAKYLKTSDEQNSPDYVQSSNNKVSVEEFKTLEGNVPIFENMIVSGADANYMQEIMIKEPECLEGLKKLYTDENVRKMCDLMICNFIFTKMSLLDRKSLDVNDEIGKSMTGIDEMPSDETRAIEFVESNLNWPLAKVYSKKFFTQDDKDRIYNVCQSVIEEYKTIINTEDFLSDTTKKYAIEKLNNTVIHSLYPNDDEWIDYSTIKFKSIEEGGTLFDAQEAIYDFNIKRNLNQLKETIDRHKWDDIMLPTTINCSNVPSENGIYILAAFCQGDAYYKGISDEDLYARLGVVIGHEISHSFDSTGAQYDKDGNLANWWAEEDYNKFLEKNKKMEEFYNKISPWKGENVHGSIVTGEAGADLGGMKAILNLASKNDKFDYDKFFRAYADTWKKLATLEAEQEGLSNVHPFDYLRININLQHFDKFLETYDIKEGDGMYLKKEDRVNIW